MILLQAQEAESWNHYCKSNCRQTPTWDWELISSYIWIETAQRAWEEIYFIAKKSFLEKVCAGFGEGKNVKWITDLVFSCMNFSLDQCILKFSPHSLFATFLDLLTVWLVYNIEREAILCSILFLINDTKNKLLMILMLKVHYENLQLNLHNWFFTSFFADRTMKS